MKVDVIYNSRSYKGLSIIVVIESPTRSKIKTTIIFEM